MLGRLQKAAIDCPEPRALAAFYCEILGMHVFDSIHGWADDPEGWVVIGRDGRKVLAFQRSTVWSAHRDSSGVGVSPGMHLDIYVDDVDEAEGVVLALTASRVAHDRERGFRAFMDPAGHPFCLVFRSEYVDADVERAKSEDRGNCVGHSSTTPTRW